MNGRITPSVHEIDVQSDAADGRQVVRCSCGWEQSTSGWMLESAQDEIRRLVAGHLAGVNSPAMPAQP
jgi:hypothetical protein